MQANCYLLTQKGTLMPATTDGELTETGLVEVTSPNGTLYTAAPQNLVSQEEGSHMLRERRGEKLVAEGYHIMHLRGDRYRVWSQKRHGDHGGYLVTLGAAPSNAGPNPARPSCTCPDFAKRGGEPCKHIHGAGELLRLAQVQKPTVRVPAVTVVIDPEVIAKAARVAAAKARLAALVARDGWS